MHAYKKIISSASRKGSLTAVEDLLFAQLHEFNKLSYGRAGTF